MRLNCDVSPASPDARSAAAVAARLAVSIGVAALVGCSSEVTSVGAYLPLSAGFYIEAESAAELSGGFTIESDPTASGERYLAPPAGASAGAPGPARARFSMPITATGDYYIWGRLNSPDAIHNKFWFQVDGGPWHLWLITTGEVWWWDRLHDRTAYFQRLRFPLAIGAHELVIANAIDRTRLDTLYVTMGEETPEGNEIESCDPPHQVRLGGVCVPSCGSLNGNSCIAADCAGRETFVVYDCPVCCFVPPMP
jgi:hypothetical protein